MAKVYRLNQVLSISDSELEYYKSQGYKVVGEKGTSKKEVSFARYEKLLDENKTIKTELEEVKTTLETKNDEIEKITSEKSELETELEEVKKKISVLEKKEINNHG